MCSIYDKLPAAMVAKHLPYLFISVLYHCNTLTTNNQAVMRVSWYMKAHHMQIFNKKL